MLKQLLEEEERFYRARLKGVEIIPAGGKEPGGYLLWLSSEIPPPGGWYARGPWEGKSRGRRP